MIISSDGMTFPSPGLINSPWMEALPLWPQGTGAFKWFFLSPFKRTKYLIRKPYITYIPILKQWCYIPGNFVTDLASIPRCIPGIYPDGPLIHGAVPHDFGYRFAAFYISDGPGHPFVLVQKTQRECDAIFTSLNNKSNGLEKSNKVIEKILNAVGGLSYNQKDLRCVDWSKPVF